MKNNSQELYKGQRNKEKYELFKKFRIKAIKDLYRERFFMLFDNRCFKCGIEERDKQLIGKPPNLCIDHHIPMVLGGHLVPGNMVSLCRNCNNYKLDTHPDEYYSDEVLRELKPLLKSQIPLFEFKFDWNAWESSREMYLKKLGVSEEVIYNTLYNEEYPHYIGPKRNDRGYRMSFKIL